MQQEVKQPQRPRSTRHLDALERQTALLKWWKSPEGKAYANGFGAEADTEAFKLDQAPTYWVTSEMADLAQAAAQSWEPEPLQPLFLPTPAGFVLFDKSIFYPDFSGALVSFRAVLWAPVVVERKGQESKQGVAISFYTDPLDPDAIARDEGVGDLHQAFRAKGFRLPPLVLYHTSVWPFDEPWVVDADEPWTVDDTNTVTQNAVHPSARDLRLFMSAFWTIVQQPLTVTDRMSPPRHLRKRSAAEFGYVPTILVITLRRVKEALEKHIAEGGDESTFEYSHRFLVSGHKRWQTYGDGTRRQIWIDTYVKGPADKPLVIKEKIFRWSR